jgi:DnaJ family protein C protein 7
LLLRVNQGQRTKEKKKKPKKFYRFRRSSIRAFPARPPNFPMVLQFFSKSPSPDKTKDKDKQKEKERERTKERSKSKKDAAKDKQEKPAKKSREKAPNLTTTTIPQLTPDQHDYNHNDDDDDDDYDFSASSSPQKSASTSPRKSSKPPSLSYRQHSRSSSAASSKYNLFSANSRSSQSRDSHPLNLPPDELRRQLFAMTAAREDSMRSSMDLDRDATASPQPADAPTPMSSTSNGLPNGDAERSPTPPPHRASPPISDGGESFKLAGNKFFKQGEYDRAIQEYNKGEFVLYFYSASLC